MKIYIVMRKWVSSNEVCVSDAFQSEEVAKKFINEMSSDHAEYWIVPMTLK